MVDITSTALIPSEEEEHVALMQWLMLQPRIKDLVIHIPNEGKRTISYAVKLKKMGVRAGVSDFLIPLPGKRYHGLWIELKRRRGSIKRDSQVKWINKMNELGYKACFAHGWEEAKDIIVEYLQQC